MMADLRRVKPVYNVLWAGMHPRANKHQQSSLPRPVINLGVHHPRKKEGKKETNFFLRWRIPNLISEDSRGLKRLSCFTTTSNLRVTSRRSSSSCQTKQQNPFLLFPILWILTVWPHLYAGGDVGLLRLVGFLKLQVSCATEPYKRDYILQQRPIISRSLPHTPSRV